MTTAAIQTTDTGAVDTGSTSRKLVAASVSSTTRRAYSSALRRLDAWLDLTGQPLTDTALAAYLGSLFDAGKSAAVKFRSAVAGQTPPTGRATRAVLAGFYREARDRAGARSPASDGNRRPPPSPPTAGRTSPASVTLP